MKYMKYIIGTIMFVTIAIAITIMCKGYYNIGYEKGFRACIEENNLYERYENEK